MNSLNKLFYYIQHTPNILFCYEPSRWPSGLPSPWSALTPAPCPARAAAANSGTVPPGALWAASTCRWSWSWRPGRQKPGLAPPVRSWFTVLAMTYWSYTLYIFIIDWYWFIFAYIQVFEVNWWMTPGWMFRKTWKSIGFLFGNDLNVLDFVK